jgi:hypothetical protein
MNAYPSWIHRIPEMIEALELNGADRIDRQTVEDLFNLRKTAAFHLLRRLGAERCGHSLVIARTRLMARLRELQEHPEWRWERERRGSIRARIDDLRPASRRSLVPTGSTLQKQINQIVIAGLPDTIQFAPAVCPFAAGTWSIWWNNWFWSLRRSIPIIKLCSSKSKVCRLASPSAGSALRDPLCKRAEAPAGSAVYPKLFNGRD